MLDSIKNYLYEKDKYILFVYFYLFIMPWNFFKWQMGVLTIILFTWWLIKFRTSIKDKIIELIKFKPLTILILFIIYSYISILWSDSIEDGYDHVDKFHKYYIFIILPLFFSLKPDEAYTGIKLVVFSFGLYAIFSLMIFSGMLTIESTNSDESNPKGIMAYAIMSVYMAIGAIVSFFIFKFSKTTVNRNLFFIIGVLCFAALFVNKSRTAQLAFILTIFILFIIYFRKNIFKIKNIFISLFISIIVVVSSFLLLKDTGKLDRYVIAYDEAKEAIFENKFEGSFSLRLYFNIVGLKVFNEEPIFGSGPEDNINKLKEYQENDPNYTYPKIFTSYHSQHIDLLTRYGIIGYLLIILSAVYLILSLKKYQEIYYLSLSFFLVVFFSSFANVMLIKKPFNYIYIALFVLFSVIAYRQNIKESKNNE